MSTSKGERRKWLAESREAINQLPLNELFELPGRPHVVYQIRSYANTGATMAEAAAQARSDMPFLFKAFETGQIGPKRMAKMHGGKPRVATIHEYLDWTVTAQSSIEDDELDFGGFHIVVILPRYVSHWPYPGDPGNCEGKKAHPELGGPLPPYPFLQTHGRPMCAATIRSGPGYLEVPFVATQDHKRGKGYCRCLVEAIEDIARALKLQKLMLCSTNDPIVKSTWHHLNFDFVSDEEMEAWDIPHADLVYLQNTTQMYKTIPVPGQYRPILIKHKDFKQRTYARLDAVVKRPRLHAGPPPKKNPPKKPATDKAPASRHATKSNPSQLATNGPVQQHSAQQEGAPSTSNQTGQGLDGAWSRGCTSKGEDINQSRSRSRSRSTQCQEPAGPEGISGSAWSQQPGGATSQQQLGSGPPGKGQPAILMPPSMQQPNNITQAEPDSVKVEPGRAAQGPVEPWASSEQQQGGVMHEHNGNQGPPHPAQHTQQGSTPLAPPHMAAHNAQPPMAWGCEGTGGVVHIGGAHLAGGGQNDGQGGDVPSNLGGNHEAEGRTPSKANGNGNHIAGHSSSLVGNGGLQQQLLQQQQQEQDTAVAGAQA